MDDELIDIIDKNNQIVGQEKKKITHKKGLRHRVGAVLLQNAKGKYLIPTATGDKVESGNLWHSAAGHVPAGESYVEATVRELFEETGIKIVEEELEFLGSFWLEKEYPSRIEKERFEVFRAQYLEDSGKIKLNPEHANEQWLSKDELREIYEKDSLRLSCPLKLSCKQILKF